MAKQKGTRETVDQKLAKLERRKKALEIQKQIQTLRSEQKKLKNS